MRILMVSQAYYPYVAKVRTMAGRLARRGQRMTVLTASPRRTEGEGATTRDERMWTAAHPVPPASGAPSRVEEIYLPSLTAYRALTINPAVVPFCLRRLREFDIVHVFGTYDLLGPGVAAFCRYWHVPYVLEPLGMFRPIIRNVGLKRLYRRLLGWPVINGADRVVATSDLERDELVEDGLPATKVVIRRNGVEIPDGDGMPPPGTFRREIGLRGEQPLVLYLGRLSRKKGLDLLLEAFRGVAQPAALAIVGPDDGDGCLQDIARRRTLLRLNGRVHVLGPRFGTEKLAAFADADVFVLPSRSENFGNAAAEAVACGVPVVVTDRCGIAPLVHDRAGLVVPCDVQAIRAALCRLVEDPGLRARLRAEATELRRQLSWDEPIAQQERLYLELVEARGRVAR